MVERRVENLGGTQRGIQSDTSRTAIATPPLYPQLKLAGRAEDTPSSFEEHGRMRSPLREPSSGIALPVDVVSLRRDLLQRGLPQAALMGRDAGREDSVPEGSSLAAGLVPLEFHAEAAAVPPAAPAVLGTRHFTIGRDSATTSLRAGSPVVEAGANRRQTSNRRRMQPEASRARPSFFRDGNASTPRGACAEDSAVGACRRILEACAARSEVAAVRDSRAVGAGVPPRPAEGCDRGRSRHRRSEAKHYDSGERAVGQRSPSCQ